jgi:hypothetical protein
MPREISLSINSDNVSANALSEGVNLNPLISFFMSVLA